MLIANGRPVELWLGGKPVASLWHGPTEVWRRDPERTIYVGSGTITAPSWAYRATIIALGGGGGGRQGDGGFGRAGNGGSAGEWAGGEIVLTRSRTLSVQVGAGGKGMPLSGASEGEGRGGDTVVTGGDVTIRAAGGAGGSGLKRPTGGSPQAFTYGGFSASGGSGGKRDDPADGPGAGGGGGRGGVFGVRRAGRDGGPGQVWVWWQAF